jgi:hypothetical protein
MLKSYYLGNPNRVHLTSVRTSLQGVSQTIDDAVGTAQLCDKDMQPLGDPIDFEPLATPGDYEAVFPVDHVALVKGQFVNILIILDGGVNLQYRGVINAKVQENIE